ncbi:MAG: DUF1570 domain-containing protein [Pirellulaceae bacterium]|nr:DUF1570 domain-containing protein [Planctomycetales bacterium]
MAAVLLPLLTLCASATNLDAAEPDGGSTDRFGQRLAELKQRHDLTGFRIAVESPFIVIGDESQDQFDRHVEHTIRWAVTRLKEQYFQRDPEQVVSIWLFRDKVSYNGNVERHFGRRPTTPFGYYSPPDRALIMDISTGGGTLVHEIVHPFMAANFPACPAWFNEGLASLYEQCEDRKGKICGRTNWRLRGLQKSIADQKLGTLAELCATSDREFYNDSKGTHYAQARYLCYYLQEKGLLERYYRQFRNSVGEDPSGYQTLLTVLSPEDAKTIDAAALETEWRRFVNQLRFP